MANTEQLDILRQGVTAWNDWRAANPGVAIDLSGAVLDHETLAAAGTTPAGKIDLTKINLCQAKLTDVQMSGLDLTHADLSYAKLDNAVFADVLLDFAMLDGAELPHSKFWNGSAPEASFWDAVLEEAVLTGANLSGANFTNANFRHANLEGANLLGAELWRADMENANLGAACLARANMTEINLHQANMHRCDLKGSNLYAARASQALMDEADIRFADLRRANLTDANVTEIHYNHASRYRGIRVKDCYGSPRFTRTANDQNYIEELRAKEWDPFARVRQKSTDGAPVSALPKPWPIGEWLYWMWFISSDCGRSLLRWTAMALSFAVLFGVAFYALGEESFVFTSHGGKQLEWSLETMIYYSVSIFAKVSTGQVTPVSLAAEVLVMVAGIAGLVTLGGLATILADKVARRA